jgi:hypothetical protein
MDTTLKLELLSAILEAKTRTQLGLQCYHDMRNRTAGLDYDMGNKTERDVVNIFYQDIEDENLGPMMEQTTEEANELFQYISQLCEQRGLAELDEEFETAAERFAALLEAWEPLSQACQQVGKRLLAELGDEDTEEPDDDA